MRISEPTAALRRILVTIWIEDGSALATDAAVGLAAGNLQVSINGAAFVNAGGTLTHVGDGLYYYEATLAEAGTPGFLGFKYERASYQTALAWAPVGPIFSLGETDATLLRMPVIIYDTDGVLTAAATATPASAELQTSTNGGAFVNAAGTLVPVGDGFYYYQGVAADAVTEGFLGIKFEKATFGTQHVWVAIASASGSLTAPIISDIEPTENVEPGEPGAFSATFKTARLTPITFHLAELADDAVVTVTVKYDNRNETYVARDVEGGWLWPFDVQADNTISDVVDGECDVSMMPRGGWPPTRVEFKVAASIMAVPE